jgi:hypothetical protein
MCLQGLAINWRGFRKIFSDFGPRMIGELGIMDFTNLTYQISIIFIFVSQTRSPHGLQIMLCSLNNCVCLEGYCEMPILKLCVVILQAFEFIRYNLPL